MKTKKLQKELEQLIDEFGLICPFCERKVPNIYHYTDNGCVFCDENYHRKKESD